MSDTRTVPAGRPAVADGIDDLVGSTPLVRLRPAGVPDDVRVLAKLESANPLSSIKDRAALFMLRAAEERGELPPGGTVVEATSGNTGIALAALSAARGYRCVIVLPDSATAERIALLGALGAEVVRTPRDAGYPGAIARAEEIHAATPGSWFCRQHENPDNVRAHYASTGPEIWAATAGEIDVLVCGVGTGGTLTGIARYLKERDPRCGSSPWSRRTRRCSRAARPDSTASPASTAVSSPPRPTCRSSTGSSPSPTRTRWPRPAPSRAARASSPGCPPAPPCTPARSWPPSPSTPGRPW